MLSMPPPNKCLASRARQSIMNKNKRLYTLVLLRFHFGFGKTLSVLISAAPMPKSTEFRAVMGRKKDKYFFARLICWSFFASCSARIMTCNAKLYHERRTWQKSTANAHVEQHTLACHVLEQLVLPIAKSWLLQWAWCSYNTKFPFAYPRKIQ